MNVESQVVDGPINMLEYETCKRAAEKLLSIYPGHLWAGFMQGPLLNIRNLSLAGDWGFRLDTRQFYSASEMDRMVMRAGGELLERFRQRRGIADRGALTELPVNFAGRHIPDL